MTTIVFLHIPKTAGQTVHGALARAIGAENISPVRVHSQADADGQMPAGYRLYSGHLDWTGLDRLPVPRFVFSILRDPRERIASFYLYLEKEARALSPAALADPGNLGKNRVLNWSADDYFFGGDAGWSAFVRDHYDNAYTGYLACRTMRGHGALRALDTPAALARALEGARAIDRIYPVSGLDALAADLSGHLGRAISFTGPRVNVGPVAAGRPRWPELLSRFESDAAARRLDAFVERDSVLMEKLGLAGAPG
ncbi:MAG: sulfotransferase family 2 domain-containing protein [Rhodobacteraceae bacterium]|nr:sulfotransferase family 2 domain-containing protein [Paracoccaceae bacterium]